MLDFSLSVNLECAVPPYDYYNTLIRLTYDVFRPEVKVCAHRLPRSARFLHSFF